MTEVEVDLGQGLKTTAWTFNGTVPGPTLEACVGDTVTLTVTNKGTMAHGLDSHAFQIDARKFGPIDPGKSLAITAPVNVPGVFMYHCAAGEMTDQHIKMGMAGLMIVYPRSPALPPAKELVVMRNGVYGTPSDKGMIAADSKAIERNVPTFFIFNGSLAHEPIGVKKGQRVRVYFVNAGPGVASFHVIGTILDVVRLSGNPKNTLWGVQTVEIGAGNGASIGPSALKGAEGRERQAEADVRGAARAGGAACGAAST
jgi:nitrite reductase (NO-forming)